MFRNLLFYLSLYHLCLLSQLLLLQLEQSIFHSVYQIIHSGLKKKKTSSQKQKVCVKMCIYVFFSFISVNINSLIIFFIVKIVLLVAVVDVPVVVDVDEVVECAINHSFIEQR
jgi:hypothetical protein